MVGVCHINPQVPSGNDRNRLLLCRKISWSAAYFDGILSLPVQLLALLSSTVRIVFLDHSFSLPFLLK